MIKIEGTTIIMTRGDTLISEVAMIHPETGDPYTPQQGDSVRFAMKNVKMNDKRSKYTDPEPLLLKDIPIDTMLLQLDPEDTKPFGFGSYVYDIQLTYADGQVDTFIADATITLTPEVD